MSGTNTGGTGAGGTDLSALLAAMSPVQNPGAYVFCELSRPPTRDELAAAIAMVREEEGTTLVLSVLDATAMGIADSQRSEPMAWITLSVHSSLAAVGLTAVVAQRLAGVGIACNVVAAFFHDHLFVPEDRAADAIVALSGDAT